MNQKKNNKYAFLSRLSTGALEEIICADIDLEDGVGDELVMCVLDVLVERSGTLEERRAEADYGFGFRSFLRRVDRCVMTAAQEGRRNFKELCCFQRYGMVKLTY